MNINLGQLRVLCIWSEFLAVGTFFRYVTFPPEAAVHVTLEFDFEVPTDLEAEGCAFADHYERYRKIIFERSFFEHIIQHPRSGLLGIH